MELSTLDKCEAPPLCPGAGFLSRAYCWVLKLTPRYWRGKCLLESLWAFLLKTCGCRRQRWRTFRRVILCVSEDGWHKRENVIFRNILTCQKTTRINNYVRPYDQFIWCRRNSNGFAPTETTKVINKVTFPPHWCGPKKDHRGVNVPKDDC